MSSESIPVYGGPASMWGMRLDPGGAELTDEQPYHSRCMVAWSGGSFQTFRRNPSGSGSGIHGINSQTGELLFTLIPLHPPTHWHAWYVNIDSLLLFDLESLPVEFCREVLRSLLESGDFRADCPEPVEAAGAFARFRAWSAEHIRQLAAGFSLWSKP